MNSDTLTSHPRRLTRSTSDKTVGGVAGGLGEYFSVDPVVFRVGFVVTTLLSGAGALAYLALLVVLPSDADAPASGGGQPIAA